jgi:hypothetical protein
MKRIDISFVIESSQHWLFYSYVEDAQQISTTNSWQIVPRGTIWGEWE